jgi:hypothetical protein
VTAVCLLVVLLFPFKRSFGFLEHLRRGSDSALSYTYAREASHPLLGFDAERQVTDFLRKRSNRADTIEVCSVVAGIRWRAERTLATRFTTVYPLILTDRFGGYTNYQKAWRREFIEKLKSTGPRFIVLEQTSAPLLKYFDRPVSYYLSAIEGFDSLIATRYRSDTVIRGYHVFERHPS